MKAWIKRVLAVIGCFVLVYLMFGYYSANFNPFDWDASIRYSQLFASIVFSIFVLFFVGD